MQTMKRPQSSLLRRELEETLRDGELVSDNVVVHMSGALACTIGFERGDVSIDGGPPRPRTLRTTHVYRYTRAKWHLVHRHADFPPTDERRARAA